MNNEDQTPKTHWRISKLELRNLTFFYEKEEVETKTGNPTGHFRAPMLETYIEVKDIPEELRSKLEEIIREALS